MSGTCALETRCQLYDRRTDTAAPCEGTRVLCGDCVNVISREVRLLRLDYADLARCMARRPGGMDTKISGTSPASTPPIDLTTEATRREIHWTLTTWEPVVREVAGLPPERTRGVRGSWAVSTAVSVIAPRIALLASLPPTWGYADGLDAGPVERDGVYAVSQLRRLHGRARRILGLTSRVVSLPGECSGCGAWSLRRDDGSETVYCKDCERTWSVDDYHRYVGLMLMSDLPRLAGTSGGES
jgi:hypothetical protein